MAKRSAYVVLDVGLGGRVMESGVVFSHYSDARTYYSTRSRDGKRGGFDLAGKPRKMTDGEVAAVNGWHKAPGCSGLVAYLK